MAKANRSGEVAEDGAGGRVGKVDTGRAAIWVARRGATVRLYALQDGVWHVAGPRGWARAVADPVGGHRGLDPAVWDVAQVTRGEGMDGEAPCPPCPPVENSAGDGGGGVDGDGF